MDSKGRIHQAAGFRRPWVRLFRRQDILPVLHTVEKLIGPLVSFLRQDLERSWRTYVTRLLELTRGEEPSGQSPLQDVEVKLTNADGGYAMAHYSSFEFSSVEIPARAPFLDGYGSTDINRARAGAAGAGGPARPSADAGRNSGGGRAARQEGSRFGAFLQSETDASMKSIKRRRAEKSRRREAGGAFRHKLEETLEESRPHTPRCRGTHVYPGLAERRARLRRCVAGPAPASRENPKRQRFFFLAAGRQARLVGTDNSSCGAAGSLTPPPFCNAAAFRRAKPRACHFQRPASRRMARKSSKPPPEILR